MNLPAFINAQTPTLKASLHHTFKAHSAPPRQIAFSPDSTILATSGVEDKTVRLWGLNDGYLLRTLTGHTLNVWHVAFSPDGRWLATTSEERTVKLWHLARG